MKAIVTGSGGLIGSACARLLADSDWEVVGVDNDMRQQFFGPQGSTRWVIENLSESLARYRHYDLDIRDRMAIRELLKTERPDFIIHAAGQPSHDKAASIPYEDFDVNAVGTLNLLVAARDYCRDSPFCFTSTNKVYGDRPNQLPLIELEQRYEALPGFFSGWPTGSRLLHPADPTSPAVTSEPKRRPRNPQIPYTPVRSWATRKGNKTLINRELSL